MKIPGSMFNRKIPYVAVGISLLGLLYFGAFFYSTSTIYPNGSVDWIDRSSDTAFGNLFDSEPSIDESTPYSVYKKILNSIKTAKQAREYDYNASAYWSVSFGWVGVQKNRWFRDIFKSSADSQFRHYLSIGRFELKDHAQFFIKDDVYNLAYVKCDSI